MARRHHAVSALLLSCVSHRGGREDERPVDALLPLTLQLRNTGKQGREHKRCHPAQCVTAAASQPPLTAGRHSSQNHRRDASATSAPSAPSRSPSNAAHAASSQAPYALSAWSLPPPGAPQLCSTSFVLASSSARDPTPAAAAARVDANCRSVSLSGVSSLRVRIVRFRLRPSGTKVHWVRWLRRAPTVEASARVARESAVPTQRATGKTSNTHMNAS